MRKFLFLERPRPSPETARTAGSCVSAEGHMTPAVSPALRPPVAPVPKSGPKSGQIRLESPRWGRDSVHSNLIAEFKFRTALFRKCSLLIREVAAVLIAEKQCHGVFVDGITMTGVPLADDVLSLVRHSHGAQVGIFLKDAAQFLHQHPDTHSLLSSAARRCFALCCSSARSAMSICRS